MPVITELQREYLLNECYPRLSQLNLHARRSPSEANLYARSRDEFEEGRSYTQVILTGVDGIKGSTIEDYWRGTSSKALRDYLRQVQMPSPKGYINAWSQALNFDLDKEIERTRECPPPLDHYLDYRIINFLNILI